MKRWNFAYDDKTQKGVDFSHPDELQMDYYHDDINDYHRSCIDSGRSAYYRLLYWTLEQIYDLDTTHGLP